MHLHTALKMAPGDAMITAKIHEVERLQQTLAIKGAPPMLQVGVPVPRPDTFGPSVLFTKGDSWMSNTVHSSFLSLSATASTTKLPGMSDADIPHKDKERPQSRRVGNLDALLGTPW